MPLASRKFLLTVLGVGVLGYLSFMGKLDAAGASGIVTLLTAYIGGNVAQKVFGNGP